MRNHNIRCLANVETGDPAVMVEYRDNSDHGRRQVFFTGPDRQAEAREFIDDLADVPPKGNYFHPAPAGDLVTGVYAIGRLRSEPAFRATRNTGGEA